MQGFCQQGGVQVNTGGNLSTNKAMGSFPGCTISVFATGTTNTIQLYADNNGTTKTDPFTADSTTGLWFFYADNQRVDIQQSGTGFTTFTLGDIIINDAGSQTINAIAFSATPTFNAGAATIFTMTLTGNVTSSTITGSSTGEIVQFSLCQDGTGGRTFAWPASFLRPPTINAAVSTCTNSTFFFDGTNWRQTAATGDSLVANGGTLTGTYAGNFTLNGNATSNGNNTFTGPNTFSGATTGVNAVYNVQSCSVAGAPAWCSGSDVGAWISAASTAIAALGGNGGGTITTGGLMGTQTFANPIVLHSFQTLQLGAVTLRYTGTADAVQCFTNAAATTVCQSITIRGISQFDSIIDYSPTGAGCNSVVHLKWSKFVTLQYMAIADNEKCNSVVLEEGDTQEIFRDLNIQGHLASLGGTSIGESSIARASNVVSVTLSSNWPNQNAQSLTVTGCSDASYNGSFDVTFTNATTLSYSQAGGNSSTSGCTFNSTGPSWLMSGTTETKSVNVVADGSRGVVCQTSGDAPPAAVISALGYGTGDGQNCNRNVFNVALTRVSFKTGMTLRGKDAGFEVAENHITTISDGNGVAATGADDESGFDLISDVSTSPVTFNQIHAETGANGSHGVRLHGFVNRNVIDITSRSNGTHCAGCNAVMLQDSGANGPTSNWLSGEASKGSGTNALSTSTNSAFNNLDLSPGTDPLSLSSSNDYWGFDVGHNGTKIFNGIGFLPGSAPNADLTAPAIFYRRSQGISLSTDAAFRVVLPSAGQSVNIEQPAGTLQAFIMGDGSYNWSGTAANPLNNNAKMYLQGGVGITANSLSFQVRCGSGSPADCFDVTSTGAKVVGTLTAAGSGPALTGTGACATFSNQVGGTMAGSAKCTGTTGASTLTITFTTTQANGYICNVQDETTRANLFQQTGHSTTSCTLTVTSVTQNDIFVFSAIGF